MVTTIQDTGPLDWRVAISDKNGRPTPEFQRRWNTQRNNNDSIPTKFTQLSDVPATYVGSTNLIVKVNSGQTGLIFSQLQSSDIPSLLIGFSLGVGSIGTNVSTPALAPRPGSMTKCKFVTKASDPTTDLTFLIKRNGVNIFSANPTVAHATATGTISTFVSLTSNPLVIAADDVFTLDITSGTSTWQGTIQLES